MGWFNRLGLGLMLLVVGCGGTVPGAAGGGDGYETVARPSTAEELGIQLDDAGRPLAGSSSQLVVGHEFDSLGRIFIPGGELLLMDGIEIWVGPAPESGVQVDLPVEEVELFALRTLDADGRSHASNDMVLLQVPSAAPVSYWGDLDFAYGTDGGLGGFTNSLVVEIAARDASRGPVPEYFVDLDLSSDHYLFDLDNLPGNDTFVFPNGWGDGGFPYALGYNADDEIVALVIWNLRYPWRTVFPASRPPAAVTQREDDLIACIEGTRSIEVSPGGEYMHCPSDSW